MAEKVFIKFATNPRTPFMEFVEVEDPAGNSINVGTWTDGNDGYATLGPFMAQVRHPTAMLSEHIDGDGLFQSDKYPLTEAGIVPLKVTDKMAHAPLFAYAQRRAMQDVQFSEDLVMCLAVEGYGPAIGAVGMVNGKPTKVAFYGAKPVSSWADGPITKDG